MENADRSLFQNLITEIKNLNTQGEKNSRVLRDSVSQDLKDLGKQFEKVSKDGQDKLKDTIDTVTEIKDNSEETKDFIEKLKDNSEETKKLIEEIRDQNSSGAIGIPLAAEINALAAIFTQTKILFDNRLSDLININQESLAKLTKIAESSLIAGNTTLPSSSVSPPQSFSLNAPNLENGITRLRLALINLRLLIKNDLIKALEKLTTNISILNLTGIGSAGSSPASGSSGGPIPQIGNINIISKLAEFIKIISDFKIVPALKTALLLPVFIKMMKKSLTEFSALMNTFNIGVVESIYEEVGDAKRKTVFSNVGSKIMEGLKIFSEALEKIQNLKIVPLWLSLKFLRYSVIPNLIMSISALGMIDIGAIKKMKNIGKSLEKVLSPISELIQKFGKSILNAGIGLIAAGVSLAAFAGGLLLLNKVPWEITLTGIGVIVFMLGSLAGASKLAPNALKTSLALVVIAGTLALMAVGLQSLGNIDWKDKWPAILTGLAVTIVVLGGLLYGISLLAPGLAVAAPVLIGLGIFAASMAIAFAAFGLALNVISQIDPKKLVDVGVAVGQFAVSLMPLILQAPMFALVAVSMGILSGSLLLLSVSALGLPFVIIFFNQIKSFVESADAAKILSIADAMYSLSGALVAFSLAMAAGTMASAATGFLSLFGVKGPLKMLKELNELNNLQLVGAGISDMAAGLTALSLLKTGAFTAMNEIPWDKIEDVADELTQGATLQIFAVANANDLNTKTLETAGASMSGGANIVTVVNNTGGNVTNNNATTNNNRNVRVPNIETGSARSY